jgi:capsular exopolysaccharide synthesis family protein
MTMDGGINDYLDIAKRWWWLFIMSAIIPMAVSYYFTSKQPDLYQAKATLIVGTSVFQNPNPNRGEIDLSDTLAAAYAELIRERPVLEAVIQRLGSERTPERLASQIGTNIRPGAQLLEIQVTDTDPEAAALIANGLADELIRRSPTSEESLTEQQRFINEQMEEFRSKIDEVDEQIAELTTSLSEMTSAAEIKEAEDRIAALELVKSRYQTNYATLLSAYRAESPNVLTFFDRAVSPQKPIAKNTGLILVVSGMAGVGLAFGAVILMEYLDTSLHWSKDSAQSVFGLPVLGAVPRVSKHESLLSGNPLSPMADGIRSIQVNVFLSQPDRPFETLLLTSPGASEGKSFIVANLAVALASAGNRVIVIDTDMRRATLHEYFDLLNVVGLSDVLAGQRSDVEKPPVIPLQGTELDNLRILSAGRSPMDPVALLTSSRFPALLESLKDQADIILLDSPPVLGLPEAMVLATLVEGTILIVSTGLTKRESARQAKDRLVAQRGVNLLGVVVNRVKRNGSYYHSSYRHGRRGKRARWIKQDGTGKWMMVGEVAQWLGISKPMARQWCKSGRLPATKKVFWWRVDRSRFKHMLEDTWEVRTKT